MKYHRFAWSREARLTAALQRHLQRGGIVVEAGRTDWRTGDNIFIPELKNDAGYIARHIARRVVGFGWTVALVPLNWPSRDELPPLSWTRIEAGKEVA